MGTWIFVRHGESVANAEGWFSGHRDVDLTPRGEDQARQAGEQLRAIRPDRIWSSDLLRAERTARIALEGRDLPIVTTPALRERTLGAWEGRDRATMRANGTFAHILTWEGRPPGGESQADLARRVLPWLAEVDTPGVHLAFAHGGVIRVLTALLDDEPVDDIGRRVIDNAEICRRDVAPGQWKALTTKVTP